MPEDLNMKLNLINELASINFKKNLTKTQKTIHLTIKNVLIFAFQTHKKLFIWICMFISLELNKKLNIVYVYYESGQFH